jgi:cell shape-determining protein MreC
VEIKRDQTVVTSGLGGNYPGGLLIGYTKNAMDMADQLFQKVSLSLPIEIEDLGTVWVIKGENKLKLVE